MDYSSFIILLARQRSGTNAMRSVLETHPDIFCLNEVFNLGEMDADDLLQKETNYFNFLGKHVQGNVRDVFPDRHKTLFLDYLEYLRCFTSKRYILIDVKYNSTHLLTKPFVESTAPPYLFDLIVQYRLRSINLRRHHYLRYILSVAKAFSSRRYSLSTGDAQYSDPTIKLYPAYVVREIERCHAQDQLIEKFFAPYEFGFAADYAEVFSDPSGGVSDAFLSRLADWLEIPLQFVNQPRFKKQSYLTLSETIENFDEIADALRGTKFEYCLQDEEMYPSPTSTG